MTRTSHDAGGSASGHTHGHHGHHDHHQPPAKDEDPNYFQIVTDALLSLLVDKGVIDADEIGSMVQAIDTRGENGPKEAARMVAKAWLDPEFKKLLIEEPRAAAAEMNAPIGHTELFVVENTPETHNLIVCTLCSCYPREFLGRQPSWYKSRAYRSRAVSEPRGLLREFGLTIPDEMDIRVHDSTADLRYMVLPIRPEGTEGWTLDQLASLVTRDSLIGVAVPRVESQQ